MAYLNCPKCGSINRQGDAVCFQCQADLTDAPPPPPPPPAPVIEEDPYASNRDLAPRRIGSDDKPKYKDLASRYEAKPVPKMDSTAIHGIRSGAIAGFLMGIVMCIYRKNVVDETTVLLARKMGKGFQKHGADVFVATMTIDFLYGILIGAILGLTNILCFTPEASRNAAMISALVAVILYYFAGTAPIWVIFVGAVHGYLLGMLASLIEKKIFRGI